MNATATPFEVRKGAGAVAEQQRVTITTNAREASFVLELDHAGVTYTTGAISIGATLAEAQAAVDAAFEGRPAPTSKWFRSAASA
ncbi:hypothetical protein HK414_16110 [Ramlibacter terrae]|uniref:Uncharacterized protein n=1 Tax=Ramlibacter terrae TaxID=2732511 RepID=A0ABX6P3P0_9BURK|nr:hypothetical protein HK414_16110 [Ramlibacter terrae]